MANRRRLEHAPAIDRPTRGAAIDRPDLRRNGPPTDSSHASAQPAPPRTPTLGSAPRQTPSNDGTRARGGNRNGRDRNQGFNRGHRRHDVYVDLYGGFAYRYRHDYPYYTSHYTNYRYCNGFFGNPYYYSRPYGHYGYSRLGLYFGFHGYYPYDRYYGYYGAPATVAVDDGQAEGRSVGALDINVRPKDVEIYLNGHYIGTAGNYDGYPQFLWLEEGEYELIFYKEGFETQRRIYDVRSGLQIDIDLKMIPGEAVAPETLSHRSVPPEEFEAPAGVESVSSYGDVAETSLEAQGSDILDARENPGRVRVVVAPSEASVYVDGRFVGTGAQVSGAYGAILVAAGKHVLEVVHPAYETRSVRFEVDADEEVDLDIPPLEQHGR